MVDPTPTYRYYQIKPVPKPRMVHSDRWRKRPPVLRYWAFCDHVRLLGVVLPEQGAAVTFCLPMPKSWSKKKRKEMNNQRHTSRPDLSNLLKALEDAVYTDDSKIWHYADLRKVWAVEGAIIIKEGLGT